MIAKGESVLLLAAGRMWGSSKAMVVAAAILGACLMLPRIARAGHTLTVRQQAVLHAWLASHAGYRLATDEDCDCQDDISQMRSGSSGTYRKIRDYHPYIVTGDFRGNGVPDFAVAAMKRSATKDGFTLLVFDGPFRKVDTPPVFVEQGLDLSHKGFSYGPPRPKPFRLVVGPFESDNTCILNPQGSTYQLDCN